MNNNNNNKPYNVFYNNFTGRIIVQKNNRYVSPTRRIAPDLTTSYANDFEKKIQELSKSINTPDNVIIENKNNTINLKSYPDSNIQNNISSNIQNNISSNIQNNISPNLQNNISSNLQNNISSNLQNNISSNLQNNISTNNVEHENIIKRKIIENSIKNTIEKLKSNEVEKINSNNVVELSSNNIKTINSNNFEKNIYLKQNVIYGIKKTILSEFNYLYQSLNSNDFKIGLNKNNNKNNCIFDSFYLFPNISEINTTTETNIINEKKVELFMNNYDTYDIQPFPIDFVPCGLNIPLKSSNKNFKKIIIKNIYWNIFQSINSNNYELDELLCAIPQKNDYIYKTIKLQINFELHSQVSFNVSKKIDNKYENQILPYKNHKIKYSTPANSCLYKVLNIKINKLNGSYFDDLEIDLLDELSIDCALLCIRISIPEESIEILKGTDKNSNLLFGNIPFSQFIINFDYELF